jgi:hypothetical protein
MQRTKRKSHSSHHRTSGAATHRAATHRSKSTVSHRTSAAASHRTKRRVSVPMPNLQDWSTRSVEGASRKATSFATTSAQGLAYGLELMALPFTLMLAMAMATMPLPRFSESRK